MQIDFNSSPGPSLGIEVELELVDAATGELASAATDILTELGAGHPDGEHPKAKHELFECTIEIITGVCQNVAEARADLEATLAEVQGAAAGARTRPALLGHPPVLGVGRPADQPQPPLRPAGRRDAVDGPSAADLRGARARGRPLAREGRGHRRRPGRLHPALPGAERLQPLLGGPRHRPGVEPVQGVRGPPHRRAPRAARELGRLRAVHGDPGVLAGHLLGARGVVGHPPPPRLRHRRAAHVRRHPHPLGGGGRGGGGPVAGGPPRRARRPRLHPAAPPRLDPAPEQVAGRSPRPRDRPHRRRARTPGAHAPVHRRPRRRGEPHGGPVRLQRGARPTSTRSSRWARATSASAAWPPITGGEHADDLKPVVDALVRELVTDELGA